MCLQGSWEECMRAIPEVAAAEGYDGKTALVWADVRGPADSPDHVSSLNAFLARHADVRFLFLASVA